MKSNYKGGKNDQNKENARWFQAVPNSLKLRQRSQVFPGMFRLDMRKDFFCHIKSKYLKDSVAALSYLLVPFPLAPLLLWESTGVL